MESMQEKLLDRFAEANTLKVFTPKDFLDLGRRDAVDQALKRLVEEGKLQRLGRGLYHLSKTNPRLGIAVSPDTDSIAEALARQTGSAIAPSGAMAANRLGLSTQVPARPVYLTNGRTRQVKVGRTVFVVKHVAPKAFPEGSWTSRLVVQALRFLGKECVNSTVVAKIRQKLKPEERDTLLRDVQYAADWIVEAARAIVNRPPEN